MRLAEPEGVQDYSSPLMVLTHLRVAFERDRRAVAQLHDQIVPCVLLWTVRTLSDCEAVIRRGEIYRGFAGSRAWIWLDIWVSRSGTILYGGSATIDSRLEPLNTFLRFFRDQRDSCIVSHRANRFANRKRSIIDPHPVRLATHDSSPIGKRLAGSDGGRLLASFGRPEVVGLLQCQAKGKGHERSAEDSNDHSRHLAVRPNFELSSLNPADEADEYQKNARDEEGYFESHA